MSSLSEEVEATEELVRNALARRSATHPFQDFFRLSPEEVRAGRVDPEKEVMRQEALMDRFWPREKMGGRCWQQEPNELIRRKVVYGELYVALVDGKE